MTTYLEPGLVAVPWPTLPTPDQARHIGQLRRMTGPRTVIDATPVAEPAARACSRAWADGPGVFRLSSGEVLCLRCAAGALRPSQCQTGTRAQVEVLRSQVLVPWRALVREDAEAAL